MEQDDPRSAAVLNRFLREYLSARAEGRSVSVDDYKARFPGFEALVERELARLESGGGEERIPEPPAVLPPLPSGGALGPYRLLRELGRGGQGVVYLALDPRLGRRVAIKLLSGLASLSERSLERLRREAALAARLDHPGICAVLECDEQDGLPYVVMRHVEGETLAAHLARAREGAGPPPVAWTLELVEQAARALHVAHAAGVVHRDVKPGNLMITPAGRAVVLDFGLARELEGGGSLTASGELFGTPGYMAPEQLDAVGRSDPRTDVHALGATLYEALTLDQPFRAPTREGLYRRILTERPEDPRRANPRVPRDLCVVLCTAMEKEPDRRYRTALDLAEDLRAVRESRPIAARPVGPATRLARWARREPRQATLSAGVLAALLVAAGLGGFLLARAPAIEAGELELARREREELIAAAFGGRLSAQTEERMRAALDQDPRNGSLRNALGTLLVTGGRPDEALAVLDAQPADGSEPRLLARLRVVALEALGRADEALALERELGEPQEPSELWTVGRGLLSSPERADQERACELIERAIYLAPRQQQVYYHDLIRAALNLEDWERAGVAAEVLERNYPDSAVGWWAISMARSGVDAQGMLAALERSLELDPDFPAALASYGSALVYFGEPERGAEVHARALELATGGPRERRFLRFAFARALGATDHLEEAVEVLGEALAEEPDEVETLLRRGELLARLGRRKEAAAAAGRALELDPGNPRAARLLGR